MLERIHGMGARLLKLRAMLAARTNAEGKPLPEYKHNVPAIRAEIASLEAATLAKAERVASQDQSGSIPQGGEVSA